METEATKVSLKKAVKNMRFWQKMYFKTKNPSALLDSKRWEKEVDRLLLEEDQPRLFDDVGRVHMPFRFVIYRTSDYKSDAPPCDGAVFEGKTGTWGNINKYTIEIASLDELLALRDKVGEDLVIGWDGDERTIEIYDDYRE